MRFMPLMNLGFAEEASFLGGEHDRDSNHLCFSSVPSAGWLSCFTSAMSQHWHITSFPIQAFKRSQGAMLLILKTRAFLLSAGLGGQMGAGGCAPPTPLFFWMCKTHIYPVTTWSTSVVFANQEGLSRKSTHLFKSCNPARMAARLPLPLF